MSVQAPFQESRIVRNDVILNWLYYHLPTDERYIEFVNKWTRESLFKGRYAQEAKVLYNLSTLTPYERNVNKLIEKQVPVLTEEILGKFDKEQGLMPKTDETVSEMCNYIASGVIRSCLLYDWHRNSLERPMNGRIMPTNSITVTRVDTERGYQKALPHFIQYMNASSPGMLIVQMPDVYGDTKFVEDKAFYVKQGSVFLYGPGDDLELYAIGPKVSNQKFPEKLIYEPLMLMFSPQPPKAVQKELFENHSSLAELEAAEKCVECKCLDVDEPWHARKSDTTNGNFQFVEFPHLDFASRIVCLRKGGYFFCELGVYKAGTNVIRRTSCGIEVYEAVDVREDNDE